MDSFQSLSSNFGRNPLSDLAEMACMKKALPFLLMVLLQIGLAGMDILTKDALNKGMSIYVLSVYRHGVISTSLKKHNSMFGFSSFKTMIGDYHSSLIVPFLKTQTQKYTWFLRLKQSQLYSLI